MSEMPLIAIVLEAGFYIFLRVTGVAHTSTLVQFANFLNLLTVAGVLYLLKRSFDAKREADLFLQRLAKESKNHIQLPGFTSPRFWKQLLDPRHSPQNCFVHENIPYWTSNEQLMVMEADGLKSVLDMALDVYRPTSAEGGDDRPVFVHIHGGGWTGGSKSLTGPLLTELISRQWIVVSVDYRLHSKAGYPSQLIDCKRALRWVKDEIRIFGGNPRNVIVGGDSAGGHLAALLALTPNQPEYQPGFEHVDTSVQGCVPQSASFDLVDLKNYSYHGARERFIKEVTRREGAADSPENIEFLMEHSPLFRIKESSIPFLVTHGDLDNLTRVQVARDFAQEFQKKSTAPLSYLEIPGGHHCFHVYPSLRSWSTVTAVAEWLEHNFGRYNGNIASGKKVPVHELVEWGWSS
ncbi:hypothetical protein BGZ99_004204 [Dissophora globulifera]|uniref:BD-FAE-like domain-containing protein n=1 Tax=Dissophora globulifera TaxID=979702 RepID=A0A9P6RTE5_9FUNG|nr:hypothetical protein BGZ99_004204 [Dissophora globulifera]